MGRKRKTPGSVSGDVHTPFATGRARMSALGDADAARRMGADDVEKAFAGLVERALAGMTDGEREGYARKLRYAAKRIERAGGKAPVDLAKARRAVVLMAEGVKFMDAVKETCGAKDFLDAKETWSPAVRVAWEYVGARRDEVLAAIRRERISQVEDAVFRAATEEGYKIDSRAAMFLLENVKGREFGARLPGRDNGGGAKVVYNNPQLTVNMIMSPDELAAKEEKALKSGEVPELDVAKVGGVGACGVEVVGVTPAPYGVGEGAKGGGGA